MDNDSTKEENQASTSKKETNQKEDEYDDRDREDRSFSDTTGSAYSGRSQLEMRADREPDRPEPPKNGLGKVKQPERKKKLRRGRVTKRRRSNVRRYQPVRRVLKKKPVTPPKRERGCSVSTIFTRLSSRSSSNAPSCTYCGHRCCGRRYKDNEKQYGKTAGKKTTRTQKTEKQKLSKVKKRSSTRRERKRKSVVKNLGSKRNKKRPTRQSSDCSREDVVRSEAIQIGSKCKVLSPLFVKSNAADPDDQPQTESEKSPYLKITPDMIYESLRKLSVWRCLVSEVVLCNHMKLNYPVNPNQEDLHNELTQKLKVAALAGLVVEVQRQENKYWCLSCDLQQRGLTKNHVTLFWHLYGDTMTPVRKKLDAVPRTPECTNSNPKPSFGGPFGLDII